MTRKRGAAHLSDGANRNKYSVKCPNCENEINTSGSVVCVQCRRWVHVLCIGLTEDELNVKSPNQKVSVHKFHECDPPDELGR